MQAVTTYDRHRKIWTGKRLEPLYNPHVSIGQVLLECLLNDPNKITQINDNNGVQITCEEMYLKTVRVTQNLIKCGIKKGDVIGVITANHHDLVPVVFAGFTIGAPINTLNPSFGEMEIFELFKVTNPKVIFCEKQNNEIVRKVSKKLNENIKLYEFGSDEVSTLFRETGMENYFVPPDIENGIELPALLICTSGTTGLPKCAALSHASILYESSRTIPRDEITLCLSSLYWVSGVYYLITGTLYGATRIISTEQFNPILMLNIISKYKVTNAFAPPAIISSLLETNEITTTDLSSLKRVLVAGSISTPVIIENFQKYCKNAKILSMYAISENSGALTNGQHCGEKAACVGQLENGIIIKIIDDNGENVGNGLNEKGEICFWKRYPFLGYVGNESATKETVDDKGWIHTGDIGYFDDEGNLHVTGRKKDILKYKNYQISPTEIEYLIEKNFNIHKVCVIGIPDVKIASDLPAALIVRKKGDVSDKVTEDKVISLVAEKLSDAKHLRGGVYFLDEFPFTSTGKILRRDLQKIAIELFIEKQANELNLSNCA